MEIKIRYNKENTKASYYIYGEAQGFVGLMGDRLPKDTDVLATVNVDPKAFSKYSAYLDADDPKDAKVVGENGIKLAEVDIPGYKDKAMEYFSSMGNKPHTGFKQKNPMLLAEKTDDNIEFSIFDQSHFWKYEVVLSDDDRKQLTDAVNEYWAEREAKIAKVKNEVEASGLPLQFAYDVFSGTVVDYELVDVDRSAAKCERYNLRTGCDDYEKWRLEVHTALKQVIDESGKKKDVLDYEAPIGSTYSSTTYKDLSLGEALQKIKDLEAERAEKIAAEKGQDAEEEDDKEM